MSLELLATARRLARASAHKPRQSDLARSISTAYYAVYHGLANEAANFFAGTSADEVSWAHVYRALDHGLARNACQRVKSPPFSAELESVAFAFVELQRERHAADYNPLYRTTRAEALNWCNRAEQALRELRASSRAERRKFIVQLLFKTR